MRNQTSLSAALRAPRAGLALALAFALAMLPEIAAAAPTGTTGVAGAITKVNTQVIQPLIYLALLVSVVFAAWMMLRQQYLAALGGVLGAAMVGGYALTTATSLSGVTAMVPGYVQQAEATGGAALSEAAPTLSPVLTRAAS